MTKKDTTQNLKFRLPEKLTDEEIEALRADLREANALAEKRWGKTKTTDHLKKGSIESLNEKRSCFTGMSRQLTESELVELRKDLADAHAAADRRYGKGRTTDELKRPVKQKPTGKI